MPAKLDGDPKNWLLIRKRDEASGRGAASARRDVRADARDARRASCRAATGWLYEVKWDGYRALAYVARRRGDAAAAATATT